MTPRTAIGTAGEPPGPVAGGVGDETASAVAVGLGAADGVLVAFGVAEADGAGVGVALAPAATPPGEQSRTAYAVMSPAAFTDVVKQYDPRARSSVASRLAGMTSSKRD